MLLANEIILCGRVAAQASLNAKQNKTNGDTVPMPFHVSSSLFHYILIK